MSFLAPLWLALAGAAAVPLLIHLLRRRIGVRVDFPAARYLVRAEQENSRQLRIRNLLAMLLRILILLLIAAAAARPVGRVGGVGHAPTALAIVLDNSLSSSAVVDGRPILDRLKQAARAALARTTAADRVWLVTADGVVVGGGSAAVRRAVDAATPLAGAGDPAGALRRAAGLARASGLAEHEVALLTDAQASTWPVPVAVEDVRVVAYVPASEPPANRAVTAATAVPARWTPSGALEARVLAAADSVTYRVTLARPGGRPRSLARGTVAGGAGAVPVPVVVRAAPADRGWVAGTVELEPDELRGDDVRHWAAWIGPTPRVAVDSDAGPFARSAVEALVQAGRAAPGAGVGVLSADALRALPALILAPADPVRVGAANRALERAGVPWRFGSPRRGSALVRAGAGPLRSDSGVTATLRYALVPRPGTVADTLARAGGEPWIVAGPDYVIVASPLDPQASSLPLRASFLPWLADAVSRLAAAGAGEVVEGTPGGRVTRPPGVDALEAPDGRRTPLATVSVEVPSRPGVYFFMKGTERRGALVVNPEGDESVLLRLNQGELAARIGARRDAVSDREAVWTAMLFTTSSRRPLAAPFLVAALVALALEAFATRARGGRPSAGAAPSRQVA